VTEFTDSPDHVRDDVTQKHELRAARFRKSINGGGRRRAFATWLGGIVIGRARRGEGDNL
jgi:hypothetical protein